VWGGRLGWFFRRPPPPPHTHTHINRWIRHDLRIHFLQSVCDNFVLRFHNPIFSFSEPRKFPRIFPEIPPKVPGPPPPHTHTHTLPPHPPHTPRTSNLIFSKCHFVSNLTFISHRTHIHTYSTVQYRGRPLFTLTILICEITIIDVSIIFHPIVSILVNLPKRLFYGVSESRKQWDIIIFIKISVIYQLPHPHI